MVSLGPQFAQQQLFDPGPATHSPPAPYAPRSPQEQRRQTMFANRTGSSGALRGQDRAELEYDDQAGQWADPGEGNYVTSSHHGIPEYGTVNTDQLTGGRIEHQSVRDSGIPSDVLWGNSTPSARNLGRLTEIPIQSSWLPVLTSPQYDVSSQRVGQILDSPSTRATPRIPAQFGRDVPVVWQPDPEAAHDHDNDPSLYPPAIIDGNHRMTSDVLEGKLFAQVREINPEHVPAVKAQTARIRKLQGWAQENENRNPNATYEGLARQVGTEEMEGIYGGPDTYRANERAGRRGW